MVNHGKLLQKTEEAALTETFQQQFYKQFGYYPAVIIKDHVITKENVSVMSLSELKSHFRKFLPKHFEKLLTLESSSRKREVVDLRFMYFKLARGMGYSLSLIGLSVNRDHTTVIHGLEQFRNIYETNDIFRQKYQNIVNYIKTKYEPSIVDYAYKMEPESESNILPGLLPK